MASSNHVSKWDTLKKLPIDANFVNFGGVKNRDHLRISLGLPFPRKNIDVNVVQLL